MKCIYCLDEKDENNFTKVEHVIPQSFGLFENNFTLKKCVCDECNQFFGDNLEMIVARDSFEGLFRHELGIKKASDFVSLGKRSQLIIRAEDGPMKGAYGYRIYSPEHNKVLLSPLPQVGFRNTSGEFDFFLLDSLPSQEELDKLGYNLKIPGSILILGCDFDTAKEKLDKKRITFKIGGEQSFEYIDFNSLIERTLDDNILRTASKIAFNYLAFWEGPEFVLDKSFDNIRSYIRIGKQAGYQLAIPNEKPILGDEPVYGRRRLGHIVTVGLATDGVSILGNVSLLNMFTYHVSLARGYTGVQRNITRGHFFDPSGHKILPLVNR